MSQNFTMIRLDRLESALEQVVLHEGAKDGSEYLAFQRDRDDRRNGLALLRSVPLGFLVWDFGSTGPDRGHTDLAIQMRGRNAPSQGPNQSDVDVIKKYTAITQREFDKGTDYSRMIRPLIFPEFSESDCDEVHRISQILSEAVEPLHSFPVDRFGMPRRGSGNETDVNQEYRAFSLLIGPIAREVGSEVHNGGQKRLIEDVGFLALVSSLYTPGVLQEGMKHRLLVRSTDGEWSSHVAQ